MRTTFTTCPLCEATCGLELTVEGDRVTKVRGDREDVFSKGFLCPKGASLGSLDADRDRLTTPLVNHGGEFREVTWDEAFRYVDERLRDFPDRDSIALYLGNPVVHSLAGGLYAGALRKALGSRNVFTASTVDQMPKQVQCGHMYGSVFSIPVPDIDRTDFMLVLGADPFSSNGSLWTVPDAPGRFRDLRGRGGSFVVVDPRRSRTAQAADQHVVIRPGTDVFLLLALIHELFAQDLVNLRDLAGHVTDHRVIREHVVPFSPEAVSERTGVDARTIRELARRLAAADRAAVYGRIGTTTVEFGTVASWAVDTLNVLTGNLDRPGGVMWPLPAHGRRGPGRGEGFGVGRWRSRVKGHPEVMGEFPAVTLADEIETPGEGQVRALITIGGNPALSLPNSARVSAALAGLDFMVSVDPYLNETTRHADVVLPAPPPSRRAHYDLAFFNNSVRNVVKYSRAPIPLEPGRLDETDIFFRLTTILGGMGPSADLDALAAQQLADLRRKLGADFEPEGETREERLLDLKLRTGAYGVSLRQLLDHPHGVDLGPLTPRLPEVLRTPSGKVELTPQPIVDDLPRVREALGAGETGAGETGAGETGLLLVGRRHLRTNNSWMHNVPALVKGKPLCTLLVNPADATRIGLADGATARVTSRVGEVEVLVEVTGDIAPGVVSMPHGWGHDQPGTRLTVAREHAGANVNLLTDDLRIDPLSGTAVLNGTRVRVVPA
ncbi:Anaerobic selenocysteine-containing dehydrogenase [Lentzea xinjiangensis]|uniref:Anaerobic selenocysteine-containing dehydrogenase n=1 Tax=Lentzea xinjiangensis TaxID=402600 RepID=A0A1H9P0B7_9PSEU|nr:molybdopterin-dependent oxidoreductase [Lentzea xinjiangensis]SER41269.1 Anaerobic selenocysteine-containing dehydrogenase [Lentzea xinjiangensis]